MDMDAEGNLIGSGTIMWFCDCCGISSETDPSGRTVCAARFELSLRRWASLRSNLDACKRRYWSVSIGHKNWTWRRLDGGWKLEKWTFRPRRGPTQ